MQIGGEQEMLVNVVGSMTLEESSGQMSRGEESTFNSVLNLATFHCWNMSDSYPKSLRL